MAITFEKFQEECKFYNPMKNFELDTNIIEYRLDPLTKESTYFNITALESGLKWSIKMDEEELLQTVEKSREGCFMCGDAVRSMTPRYLENILPEGRLTVGQAILFPNIFGLARYSAVLTYPNNHFFSLDEYTPEVLIDTFTCALEFIKRVYKEDKEAKYAAFGCNYLFPAGSSTVHSHFHVFITGFPFDHIKGLASKSEQYFHDNSNSYWSHLLETEKKEGKRYLGAVGNTHWLVPYAPSGVREVQGLVEGKTNFIEFEEEDIRNLSEGLSRVLKYYRSQGVTSFNLITYSGSLGEKQEYFWPGLKIVTRGYLPPYYTSDITWRQKLLFRKEEWFDLPETVASQARKFFIST
ncbi:MAG: hypothetical protein HY739_11355 [Desulfobacterales bacterium]|nr:hypothetical protein [Desulfobacterales bacterium]